MENVQAAIAAVTFIGVILLIITEWIHLTVAAFLGALILVFTHVMTLNNAIEYIGRSHGTLGLFFGVMVMVRAFEPTKVFDYLATQMVLLAKGKGKNLLLGIVEITTPLCSFAQCHDSHAPSPINCANGRRNRSRFCAVTDFNGICS